MISNQTIHLDNNSPKRLEAENIIKYTLLLSYDITDLNADSTDIIGQIMDNTHKCCSFLFANDPKYIVYNFFGTLIPRNPNTLAYLNAFSENGVNIHNMILQNSVMSAYHAILTEYLSSYAITSYTLNNLKEYGAYAAYKKGIFSVTETGVSLSRSKLRNSTKDYSKNSSKASDFNKLFKNKYKAIPSYMNFLLPGNEAQGHYLLQYATLCKAICGISPSMLRNLYGNKSKKLSPEYISDAISSLINAFTPPIQKFSPVDERNFVQFGGNIVDGVYQYYLAEKIFNMNLFYSLAQIIKEKEKNSNYRFSNSDILEGLSTCKKLPNPFSRTYLLHYAFDHIDDKCISYQDYWHDHDIEKRDVAMSIVRKMPPGFQFDKWFRQFQQFIIYMSDHVIPIYDWCFLTMLLNVIERTNPDKSHIFHLEKCLDILGAYITKNYRGIMKPIILKDGKSMDGVDMISQKKFYLDQDKIELLCQSFFKETDIELNLKSLDLESFKGTNNKHIKIIQDFYNDLLFEFY